MQFSDCENVLFTKPSGRVSFSSHWAVSMSACESLSSPEPSPIKLEGPGFHVHERRTMSLSAALSPCPASVAAQQSTVMQLNDDDDDSQSSLPGMQGHGNTEATEAKTGAQKKRKAIDCADAVSGKVLCAAEERGASPARRR